jgi:hypothetical protein
MLNISFPKISVILFRITKIHFVFRLSPVLSRRDPLVTARVTVSQTKQVTNIIFCQL